MHGGIALPTPRQRAPESMVCSHSLETKVLALAQRVYNAAYASWRRLRQ